MSNKSNRQLAAEALAAPADFADAVVEERPRSTSIVFSTRLDAQLADWVAAEADRRGVKPGVIIRDAVTAAAQSTAEDQTVTIRLGDLHRAINRLVAPTRPRAA